MGTFEIVSNLRELVAEKIEFGENLLKSLTTFEQLDGIQKLRRKIRQEVNFLRKVYKTDKIKKEHLQCSNLTHFTALITTLRQIKQCVSIVKAFVVGDRKILVDIVCDDGLMWIKVVARNPKSINQICMGNSNYGVRSILDQANDFLECAKLYPCLFQTPAVKFVFTSGIGKKLACKLENMGIVVEGDRLWDLDEDFDENTSNLADLCTKNTSLINKVNLDVSAMLAYVSSVTNGSCKKYEFSVPVLTQQANWESKRPTKPILDALFKDKTLYCCQTAKESFLNILYTVGGPNERIRGEELLGRTIILPDDATVANTLDSNSNNEVFNSVQYTSDKNLSIGGKIKERSLIIFTFGDRIKAITVTSNDGFVRAAKQQGINFVVFVHESRALTEQKETTKAIRVLS